MAAPTHKRKLDGDDSKHPEEKKLKQEEKKWKVALDDYRLEKLDPNGLASALVVRDDEAGSWYIELGETRVPLQCGDIDDYRYDRYTIDLAPVGFFEYAMESFWRNTNLNSVPWNYGFTNGFAFYDAIVVYPPHSPRMAPSLVRSRAGTFQHVEFVSGTFMRMGSSPRPCDNLLLLLNQVSKTSKPGCVNGVWVPIWMAWCRQTSASLQQQVQVLCLLLAYSREPTYSKEQNDVNKFRRRYGIPRIDSACVPPTFDILGLADSLVHLFKNTEGPTLYPRNAHGGSTLLDQALGDCICRVVSMSPDFGFRPSRHALRSTLDTIVWPLIPPLVDICMTYCSIKMTG